MAIEKEVSYSGQSSLGTLGGQIRIEEGTGRLVIYDSVTGKEINVVDRSGYKLTDGTVTTRITADKFIQNDGTNDRILLGDDA